MTNTQENGDVLVYLSNNKGVVKPACAAASFDASRTTNVTVTPTKFSYSAVHEWLGDVKITSGGADGQALVTLTLGPGDAVLLHFEVKTAAGAVRQKHDDVPGISAASPGSCLPDSALGLTEGRQHRHNPHHNLPAEDITDRLLVLSVTWHPEKSHIYLGSPSVLRLTNGTLLITTDRFGTGFNKHPRNVSLYTSDDNGDSWRFRQWILSEYWANLFQVEGKGKIYLLGTATDGPAPIKISSSADGLTWHDSDTAILSNETYNTGPTPSLVSGGRIYRAMERFVAPHHWGRDYQAMLLHAALGADLLDPAAWTVSESLALNESWLPKSWGTLENPGYLEGNAVEGPDGEVYNILRLNSMP